MTDPIDHLEAAMYATLVPGAPQIKVARLVTDACDIDNLPPENTINAALERLVTRHDIDAFGIIKRWRHSEIRRS